MEFYSRTGGWEIRISLCFALQHNGILVEWVGGKSELACVLQFSTMEFYWNGWVGRHN